MSAPIIKDIEQCSRGSLLISNGQITVRPKENITIRCNNGRMHQWEKKNDNSSFKTLQAKTIPKAKLLLPHNIRKNLETLAAVLFLYLHLIQGQNQTDRER